MPPPIRGRGIIISTAARGGYKQPAVDYQTDRVNVWCTSVAWLAHAAVRAASTLPDDIIMTSRLCAPALWSMPCGTLCRVADTCNTGDDVMADVFVLKMTVNFLKFIPWRPQRVWRNGTACQDHNGVKSRTERPGKTKIGTELAPITHDSDTTFKDKRSKVKVTRPLCSPQFWRVWQLQRWAWERVGRWKLLLRCRLLDGARRFGAHGGGEGRGHIVAAARLQLVNTAVQQPSRNVDCWMVVTRWNCSRIVVVTGVWLDWRQSCAVYSRLMLYGWCCFAGLWQRFTRQQLDHHQTSRLRRTSRTAHSVSNPRTILLRFASICDYPLVYTIRLFPPRLRLEARLRDRVCLRYLSVCKQNN